MPVVKTILAACKTRGDMRDGLVAMAIALGASFGAGGVTLAVGDPAAMSLWFGDGSVLRPKPKSHAAALPKAASGPGIKTERKAPAAVTLAVDSVLRSFASLGFDLGEVQSGASKVPRLFLATLPKDLADVAVPEKRKVVFIGTILPLVLRVNEKVLADRQRILGLRDFERKGGELKDSDREWLRQLADRYGAERPDYATLLYHVDIVPPSLALAQAAEESGWGTSRFAAMGNSLFGQRVWKRGAGMTPAERDSRARFEVRKFAKLESSVAAYIHNLNSHAAYRGFRDERAAMRDTRRPRQGEALVAHLERYSERGADYVQTLRDIIRDNNFSRFDTAKLHPETATPVNVAFSRPY
jgi:Bax protein